MIFGIAKVNLACTHLMRHDVHDLDLDTLRGGGVLRVRGPYTGLCSEWQYAEAAET